MSALATTSSPAAMASATARVQRPADAPATPREAQAAQQAARLEAQAAQQSAQLEAQAVQQAATATQDLAHALREQGNAPVPPPPPGAPEEFATVNGAPQPVVVIDGRRYLLSRESGGEAMTVAQAKTEFGEDTNEILHNVVPIVSIIFGCITVWVVVETVSKFLTKRAERVQQLRLATAAGTADGDRFNRLEQAVEAVALEVERITEAQRFQTKLLTERAASLPEPAQAFQSARPQAVGAPTSR